MIPKVASMFFLVELTLHGNGRYVIICICNKSIENHLITQPSNKFHPLKTKGLADYFQWL